MARVYFSRASRGGRAIKAKSSRPIKVYAWRRKKLVARNGGSLMGVPSGELT